MFAKDFEYLLTECCRQSDVSPVDATDVAARFHSLRGHGKLPRGRENRSRRLTTTEIAAATLGLVPVHPKWAGHAAVILGDMRPVGGAEASFHGATNLTAAVENLLTDRSAREGFLSLTLSVAERFPNSNGFATLAYQEAEIRRRVSFVSNIAMSLFQSRAERSFEVEDLPAPVSRSVVFSRTFFDRVDKAVARSVAFPEPPAGDGSEYNEEEAQQTRYRALGVRNNSRFLNLGVGTQVTWPMQEMLVRFDRYHLVLMPKTKEHTQSIHVDLRANHLTDREAITVVNRFLSVLAWCDDQFAVAQDGWSGNPVPVAVPRRDLAFATAHDWAFARKIPPSDEARRALALYREGRNAEETALVSYAVLSYFKIIELRYPDSSKIRKWVAKNFGAVSASATEDLNLREFLTVCGSEAPADYIYTACRVAVAHASIKRPSDADDVEEVRRLHSAAYVLRLLARLMILHELGVSDRVNSGD